MLPGSLELLAKGRVRVPLPISRCSWLKDQIKSKSCPSGVLSFPGPLPHPGALLFLVLIILGTGLHRGRAEHRGGLQGYWVTGKVWGGRKWSQVCDKGKQAKSLFLPH